MTTELQTLHARWHEITSEDMPIDIASQPIELIRKAVKWRAKGITVAIPSGAVPMAEKPESSLREWDHSDETKIES